MVIASGTVRNGTIEVQSTELPEGTRVTVLAPEGDETFTLSREDEAMLLAATQEANRGSVVPGEELLTHLRRS